jgi:two-component system LytT family response regulator
MENTRTPLYTTASSSVRMKIGIPTMKGITVLNVEDIVYCEAQRSYTYFHLTNNRSILISKPLFDYDKLLADSVFFRVHKSFLINLLHVKEYRRGEGGSVIMSNGTNIDVSRRKKELFLSRMKESFKY